MARAESAPTFRHEALAAVFRVSAGRLTVLAWRREREPYAGAWALPSGPVERDETLGACVARQLASKVELTEIAHLEQLETRSDPGRDPAQRTIATAYLGLVPTTAEPELPSSASWRPVSRLSPMAFDHRSVVLSALERLRHKLSYSNIAFALAPGEFTIAQLRDLYTAVLGYEVSATNLQRVLQRRGQLRPLGRTAPSASGGGRPAALFAFRDSRLQITDPFAVLRPSEERPGPG